MKFDRRFALKRDGELWFAALIADSATEAPAFRVSQFGKTRDAYGQAAQVLNLEAVARLVILEGMRARFVREDGPASSLGLRSRRVVGYLLDESIARRIGVPAVSD